MHELAICRSLLHQVESIAHDQGAQRIQSINLELGPLSGIEASLLYEAFSQADKTTLTESAQLSIAIVPLRVSCRCCSAITTVIANCLVCGNCGDWHTQLISGDEMRITTLEFEINAEDSR